jgi:DNA polymerase I-like protein with 3'-5' exonuclease and polymerase domains
MLSDKERFNKIDALRKKAKVVNYSSLYGVGSQKLSREMGIPEVEARKLLDAFWERNWAIKKVSENFEIKKIGDQMWIKNPVSGFWLSLRYDKDKWSTINQSSGVFCFDTWLFYVSLKLPEILGQFHDEGVWEIPKGTRDKTTKALQWAIDKTNEKLNLNITLGISIQYGDDYAQIH